MDLHCIGGIMELKIVKWGNSAAVRLPSLLLDQIKVSIGTTLNADVRPDGVLISPARPKYALSALIAQCDANAPIPANAVDWERSDSNGATGKEVW